jgi:hypothetical protein
VRCARSRLLVLSTLAAAACQSSGDAPRGMPPPSAWKPPTPQPSVVEPGAGGRAQSGDDPRVAPSDDPHAGLDMASGQSDPHASATGDQDPHAGLDMGEEDPAMAGMEAPDPNRPIDPNKFLRGVIRAGKDMEAGIRPGAVLFLSAWPIEPTTGEVLGSPVAVAKMDIQKLPMKFELSERDVMVAGTRFEGEVLISARVDGDGEARTKEPGDVEGRMRARIPAKDLDLVLDTALR